MGCGGHPGNHTAVVGGHRHRGEHRAVVANMGPSGRRLPSWSGAVLTVSRCLDGRENSYGNSWESVFIWEPCGEIFI